MRNLNSVDLNYGSSNSELNGELKGKSKRYIGFYEGPYSRTAQIEVPYKWKIHVLAEYDTELASKTFDERFRTLFCVSVSPEGDLVIGHRWRIGSYSESIRMKSGEIRGLEGDLNKLDPADIVKNIKTQFKVSK